MTGAWLPKWPFLNLRSFGLLCHLLWPICRSFRYGEAVGPSTNWSTEFFIFIDRNRKIFDFETIFWSFITIFSILFGMFCVDDVNENTIIYSSFIIYRIESFEGMSNIVKESIKFSELSHYWSAIYTLIISWILNIKYIFIFIVLFINKMRMRSMLLMWK